MQAVVLAAGQGTRLRPLTEDKPKGMVEVAGKPILTHCFEQLIELGADELHVVVGYKKQAIIEHYDDAFEGVPITYSHQREQQGLAHALLTVEEQIDDDFMLMLGDNVFRANLEDVVAEHQHEVVVDVFLDGQERMGEAVLLALMGVGNRDALELVLIMVDDGLLLVADDDVQLVGTQLDELLEAVGQDWLAPDLDHLLGLVVRQRPESRPLTGSKYDCLHG